MAKSPTPIPTQPVKVHRAAQGTTRPAQKRRRKKRNPILWFLQGVVRRIYFGIKTDRKSTRLNSSHP